MTDPIALGITDVQARVSEIQSRLGMAPRPASATPGTDFASVLASMGVPSTDDVTAAATGSGQKARVQDVDRAPVAIRPVLAGRAAAPAGGAVGATPYAALFRKEGAEHGVDPRLLEAVARAESSLRPDAVSPAGAQGLMQLMPSTARGLGVNPFDPAQGVDGAARLLSEHLQRYGGNTALALAAYNAGPGAVARYGGIPPYTETQNYVRRVLDLAGRS